MRFTTKNLIKFLHNAIDIKMGLAGALVMGAIIFFINYYKSGLLVGSTTAALKQAAFTFLFGGVFMKGCENLSVYIKKDTLAIFAAVIIPSTISILMVYGLHNLKGTPLPFYSTLPTAILIIPSTLFWAIIKRKGSFPKKQKQ